MNKREYRLISGIEENEKPQKRIRKFLKKKFDDNPKSFFLEWNIYDMIVKEGHEWAYPKEIKKLALFLNISYVKEKETLSKKQSDFVAVCNKVVESFEEKKKLYKDIAKQDVFETKDEKINSKLEEIFSRKNEKICTLSLEVVHSPYQRLTGIMEKRYKSIRKESNTFLLLSIHNNELDESLSSESIDLILKQFNLHKTKISDDLRLLNVLTTVCKSISEEEEIFSLKMRKIFFHPQIRKHIIPESSNFVSMISRMKK